MKKIFFLIVLCFGLSSCTLRPHERGRMMGDKKVSAKELIYEVVGEYMSQEPQNNNGKETKQQAGMGYSFDNSVYLKIPPNMAVHSNPSRQEFKTPIGKFSRFLPGGWGLLVFEDNESMIIYDFNADEHPVFTDIDAIMGVE